METTTLSAAAWRELGIRVVCKQDNDQSVKDPMPSPRFYMQARAATPTQCCPRNIMSNARGRGANHVPPPDKESNTLGDERLEELRLEGLVAPARVLLRAAECIVQRWLFHDLLIRARGVAAHGLQLRLGKDKRVERRPGKRI